MPFSLAIDEVHDCILVGWYGKMTPGDLSAYYDEIEALPGFRPGLKRIHDLRRADVNLERAEIRSIADAARLGDARQGQRQIVFLVGSDAAFGIARVLMVMRESCTVTQNVFRDFDRARAWLKLPDDYEDPFPIND